MVWRENKDIKSARVGGISERKTIPKDCQGFKFWTDGDGWGRIRRATTANELWVRTSFCQVPCLNLLRGQGLMPLSVGDRYGVLWKGEGRGGL